MQQTVAPVRTAKAFTPPALTTSGGGKAAAAAANSAEPSPTFAPTDCTVFKLENGAMFQQIGDLPDEFYKVTTGDVQRMLASAQAESGHSDVRLVCLFRDRFS